MLTLPTPDTLTARIWIGPSWRRPKIAPQGRPAAPSAKDVFRAGDEDAGAARLAPDALVARPRRTVIVVAREELLLVDPQLTVEEMQLLDAGMRVSRVARAGRQAHQHADPVSFRVGREQLSSHSGR